MLRPNIRRKEKGDGMWNKSCMRRVWKSRGSEMKMDGQEMKRTSNDKNQEKENDSLYNTRPEDPNGGNNGAYALKSPSKKPLMQRKSHMAH